MPKGKTPRRSKIYANANEKKDNGKGIMVIDDMRPSTPHNLKARQKLHEANDKNDYKIYTDFKKKSKERSLGAKQIQVTPGEWKTK